MGSWSTLKTAIANAIKSNNNQEITGPVLQVVLKNIVSNVGEHATFAGWANSDTTPGAPDGVVFYIAAAGTYPNFAGLEIPVGGIGIITNASGNWELAGGDTYFADLSAMATSSPSFVVCDNPSKTINWTVDAPGFKLDGNTRIVILMKNQPSSQIPPSTKFTLNINNTGAKQIIYNGHDATRNTSWLALELLDVFYAASEDKYFAYSFMPNSEEVANLTNEVVDLQGLYEQLAERVKALEEKQ